MKKPLAETLKDYRLKKIDEGEVQRIVADYFELTEVALYNWMRIKEKAEPSQFYMKKEIKANLFH